MRLSRSRGFTVVALLIGSLLAASATPTPLYGDYAARWHFSSATLTVVYAVYAIGVLTSLIAAGRISDKIGRRPVMAVALAGLLIAMGLLWRRDPRPGCSRPAASRVWPPAWRSPRRARPSSTSSPA